MAGIVQKTLELSREFATESLGEVICQRRKHRACRKGERTLNMSPEVQYLTPKEVAEILRISVYSVYRRFENVPGVIILDKERKRGRTHRTFRIPPSALEYYANPMPS